MKVNNYGKDERPTYNTFSVKESFTQSLMEQLGYRNLSKHQRDIAAFLIGSLDASGYLRRDIDSVVDDLAFRANIESSPEEVEAMLKVIQEFDPVGVGARNLQECFASARANQVKEVRDAVRFWRIISTNSPIGISRRSFRSSDFRSRR